MRRLKEEEFFQVEVSFASVVHKEAESMEEGRGEICCIMRYANMSDFHFQMPPHLTSITRCEFANIKLPVNANLVVRREFYECGDTTGEHLHLDFCALYVVKAGRGIHNISGQSSWLAKGDVYLLPPGTTHTYLNFQKLEIDAFYFPLSIWNEEELIALREISGFWRLFTESEARRFHLRPEAHQKIECGIAEMRSEFVRIERAAPLLLHALLFRLLVMLSRSAANDATDNGFESRPLATLRLAELLTWCEANVGSEISVTQLAERMFLSTAHFARLFKREMGMPPATYLRCLRLEQARDQLENTERSVSQIALNSGFDSVANFSRTFRAFYGSSPRKFRRNART